MRGRPGSAGPGSAGMPGREDAGRCGDSRAVREGAEPSRARCGFMAAHRLANGARSGGGGGPRSGSRGAKISQVQRV